jgi:hypothetical protein
MPRKSQPGRPGYQENSIIFIGPELGEKPAAYPTLGKIKKWLIPTGMAVRIMRNPVGGFILDANQPKVKDKAELLYNSNNNVASLYQGNYPPYYIEFFEPLSIKNAGWVTIKFDNSFRPVNPTFNIRLGGLVIKRDDAHFFITINGKKVPRASLHFIDHIEGEEADARFQSATITFSILSSTLPFPLALPDIEISAEGFLRWKFFDIKYDPKIMLRTK